MRFGNKKLQDIGLAFALVLLACASIVFGSNAHAGNATLTGAPAQSELAVIDASSPLDTAPSAVPETVDKERCAKFTAPLRAPEQCTGTVHGTTATSRSRTDPRDHIDFDAVAAARFAPIATPPVVASVAPGPHRLRRRASSRRAPFWTMFATSARFRG